MIERGYLELYSDIQMGEQKVDKTSG
jgi:hypothetical protein